MDLFLLLMFSAVCFIVFLLLLAGAVMQKKKLDKSKQEHEKDAVYKSIIKERMK
jgi:uncharacterized membrane protein